jgi:glucose/arabinose dehydrogenase
VIVRFPTVARLLALAAALLASALLAGAAPGAKGFRFREIASGLTNAVYVTSAPGDASTLYVVEQQGEVVTVQGGRQTGVFLDIRDRVGFEGERGLLGLAFHPGFEQNGLVYVDYTGLDGTIHVVELHAAAGVADPSSARELLAVEHPWPNHNGGNLQFDRRGYLWVGIGDGGTDPDAGPVSLGDPNDNAQNPASRLGKLLRIDPTAAGATWQTVAMGLRNPWRFSFDRKTGDLWIGDVGAATYEEVDFRPAKVAARLADFGWSRFEGLYLYNRKIALPKGVPLVRPLLEYGHTDGVSCSIIGGYVYRGSLVPAARGLYFFGDYCSGRIYTLRRVKKQLQETRSTYRFPLLSSFGEDAKGELYAVTTDGHLYQLR